jgi:tetratricopeptide (TPR) repeat protein
MTLSRARRLQLALLFAASIVLVAALYARALRYELVWMDEAEIGEGAILLGPGESWASAFTRPLHRGAGVNPYYRPLQILVVTGIHRVAGPSPAAYRVALLVLAVATCTAFGALALYLWGSLPLALLATALAAAHPAMIESWVWISGLGEAMAAFFGIASIVLGLIALAPAGRIRTGFAALSTASLVLALFSKEKAVATPLLLAVAWFAAALRHASPRAVFEGRATLRRAALLVGAQVAIVALYVVAWRPLMLGHALAAAPPIGGDRATHLLSALAAWPASFAWLAAPLHSCASDTVAIVRSFGDTRVWLGLAIPLAILAAAVLCVLRGRPIAALGLVWVWLAFLPTANLFPQIHARAERYLFLSVFGAVLVVVDLLDAFAGRVAPRARITVAVAIGAVLALGLAERTWLRTPDWQSTESLFRRDVARDPAYSEGRFHLARTLALSQRSGEAAAELASLRELRPERSGRWGYVNEAGVRELGCVVDLALGRRAEVVASFQALERNAPSAAEDPALRSCAAQALEGLGRTAEANALYQRVVASLASEPPAAVSLALARTHAKLGHREEAQDWLNRAERDGPRDPTFSFQLRQVEKLLRQPR